MLKKSQVDRPGNHSSPQAAADGWRPPGGYSEANLWAVENRAALEQYAERNEREGTAAEQLERFLAGQPEMLT
jgi:hypothetical protein